jgi:ABC-2 type transport system permease protein
MREDLVGTPALVRLALRRDRWLLPLWILGFAFMAYSSAVATKDLYPEVASRVSAAETVNATAALVALYGRIYDPSSIGALSLFKLTALGAAMVAILMVWLVVRHTRAEEETGRLELVGAGVVGRAAPLAAALIVAIGGSVALGLLTTLALIAGGLSGAGSVAFGVGWALTGIAFAAVAAVTAQVTTGSRAAIGLGVVAIGVAYALRAVGDLAEQGPGWASWLSPIGWTQQIRPFAGDRLWVGLIPLVFAVVLVVAAFVLRSRRDIDAGVLPDRPGPAVGRLHGVYGLAWRLQRGLLIAWAVGVAAMGMVLGSVAHNVSGLLDSPQMKQYLVLLGGEQGITDAFLAAEIGLLGTIIAAYGIAATAHLRSEEAAGHTELLLSTATTRTRWAGSHYVVAMVGVAVVVGLTGLAAGLGHGLAIGDLSQVGRVGLAAAAQIPAAWVMASIVLALFGSIPRWIGAAWALFAVFVVVGEFGSLWQLPDWVLQLSPFAHSPRLPGGEVVVGSLTGLVVAAAVLAALGFVGWRRRDLAQ